jgi:hypothetical protein
MTKLQLLEKEFCSIHKSQGMQYVYPSWDFAEVQLDGWYSADQLRKLADDLDEYNRKASKV